MMKKLLLLVSAVCLIGIGSASGQDTKEYESFFFTKGYVKANQHHYKLCSFSIKAKNGVEVIVEHVYVNGVEAKLKKIKISKKDVYLIKIPDQLQIPLGTTFDLQINIGTLGGFLMGITAVDGADDSDGGPGGPGGGGDPTVIIIKYP